MSAISNGKSVEFGKLIRLSLFGRANPHTVIYV